jgi:hypothetical protein
VPQSSCRTSQGPAAHPSGALLFSVSAKAAIIHKGQMEIAHTAAGVSVMVAQLSIAGHDLCSAKTWPRLRAPHTATGAFYLLAGKLCDPNARAAPKGRHVVLGVGCRSVPKSQRSFHRRSLPVDGNWFGL